jgi:ADP-heptose:LPS heptosyltransferase
MACSTSSQERRSADAVALRQAGRAARHASEGALPEPRLRVEPQEIEAARRRFGIEGAYGVFCPGAEYGPAKRWPYFPN